MTDSPLVSIVIPAYNCEKFIVETLNSLFQQDYEHIEIIVDALKAAIRSIT